MVKVHPSSAGSPAKLFLELSPARGPSQLIAREPALALSLPAQRTGESLLVAIRYTPAEVLPLSSTYRFPSWPRVIASRGNR